MPCFCHYEPSEDSKKLLKEHCLAIVTEVKRMTAIGDPLGCTIRDVHELIDHLYDPRKCKEKANKD